MWLVSRREAKISKKGSARWEGVNPHDILRLTDNTQETPVKGDILHYSYPTISSHIEQTNKFTTIAARASFDAGVRSSVIKIVTRPILKFLRAL